MNYGNAVVLVIVIVLIYIMIIMSIDKTKGVQIEHHHSITLSEKKSIHKRKNTEFNKYMPVKTICRDLNITPVFECHESGVDIHLDITGGISPYKYKWSNGSEENVSSNVSYGENITVIVTDARGCVTKEVIQTPIYNKDRKCNNL